MENDPWVARLREAGDVRVRLFCLPQAGAGPTAFQPWTRFLPPDIELCPIRLPGRESRVSEPPFTEPESLLDALEKVIGSRDDLPFALFGSCSGAFVAYELARRLRPIRLLVSAQQAPHWPRTDRLDGLSLDDLRTLLRDMGGTDEVLLASDEMMEMLAPLVRADLRVSAGLEYVSGPPLPMPISVFAGRHDTATPRDGVAAWLDHTDAEFTLRVLPGRHFFAEAAVRGLVEALSADLAADLA